MFSLEPQFFDIFGALGFLYITIVAFLTIYGKLPPKWAFVILFLVGIIGLLVDAGIVYTAYFK